MKKILLSLLISFSAIAHAQHFISNGMIEYEVRVNNHKMFGDGIWAEMFKDKIPQFSTSWYQLTFNDNKAVYKFDRLDEKGKLPWDDNNAQDNFWYNDYTAGTFTDQKFVFDNTYLLSDSLMKIDWKMVPNETRILPGLTAGKRWGKFLTVYMYLLFIPMK